MRCNLYLLTMLSRAGNKFCGIQRRVEMVTSSMGTLQINTNVETQMIRNKENRRVELKKTDRMLAVKFCHGEVIVILLDDCWLVESKA